MSLLYVHLIIFLPDFDSTICPGSTWKEVLVNANLWSRFKKREKGGSVAELLGHQTWNPEVAGSSPVLTSQLKLFLGGP